MLSFYATPVKHKKECHGMSLCQLKKVFTPSCGVAAASVAASVFLGPEAAPAASIIAGDTLFAIGAGVDTHKRDFLGLGLDASAAVTSPFAYAKYSPGLRSIAGHTAIASAAYGVASCLQD
jgi:hypothetical protein